MGWHEELIRADDAYVSLDWVKAFPQGALFSIAFLISSDHGWDPPVRPVADGMEAVRFAVQLPDGRKVEAASHWTRSEGGPDGPVFAPRGGGGGSRGDRYWEGTRELWLWPLPSPGRLRFAAAWPEKAAGETVVDFDTDDLIAAAGRAVRLPGAED